MRLRRRLAALDGRAIYLLRGALGPPLGFTLLLHLLSLLSLLNRSLLLLLNDGLLAGCALGPAFHLALLSVNVRRGLRLLINRLLIHALLSLGPSLRLTHLALSLLLGLHGGLLLDDVLLRLRLLPLGPSLRLALLALLVRLRDLLRLLNNRLLSRGPLLSFALLALDINRRG
jgi:hypothetical protein